MKQKKRNPEAVAAAFRVVVIDAFPSASDVEENTHFTNQSPAARFLMRRFPLTEQRARILAELSGLGGGR